jgi:hypothetical protein
MAKFHFIAVPLIKIERGPYWGRGSPDVVAVPANKLQP